MQNENNKSVFLNSLMETSQRGIVSISPESESCVCSNVERPDHQDALMHLWFLMDVIFLDFKTQIILIWNHTEGHTVQ